MSSDLTWSDLASRDPGRALAAAGQLLPFWVSLGLVLLIGWQAARIVWMFVPAPAAGVAVEVPALPGIATSAGSTDVSSIAAASLFGKADPEDATAVAEPLVVTENLEETDINLTLKGTIAADAAAESAAIIEIGSGDEQVFTIGETVTSGASLHAVYTDRVVLDENGRLTALYLPDTDKSAPSRPARRTPSARTANRNRAAQQRSVQSVVANNAARLSDVIRPTPYFVDGQQQGYRVYPGRDRRSFAALGLRAGDLVLDIDGQSLSDPSQAMEIFQSLGNAQQVTVTVERNGNPETIVLSTDQFDLAGEDDDEQ